MNKSFKNIFYSVGGQIITIIIGLLLPRLRIVSFGSEVNGMLASVQQVYTYLALLEAGVGTATLQALYGPVAKGNKKQINQILSATNHYYKKTGYVYLSSVLIFALVYPLIVRSQIPTKIIVAVILLNGLGNVLAYFFQGKYRILLQAEGKQYIVTNLTTFVTVFSGISKIGLIYAGCGVISLQAAYFGFNLLQVCYFAWYIKKHYRWINLKEKENFQAISQKNSVLVHQISQMVFNNTDVLLLTIFCDLKIVSVYALYNMIFDMISTLMNNVNSGFSYKLGQLFNSERGRFDRWYTLYERYYTALSFSVYFLGYILIVPFLKLYTRGVTDTNYLLEYLPLMFTAIKLMVSGRAPSGFVATFAGHFKKTQNRAILEMVINLVVSIICVNIFGIYGVLMGTIAALLYRANDMILYANRIILKRSAWATYKWWVLDLGLFLGLSIVCRNITISMDSYAMFFLVAAVLAIITVCLFLGATFMLSIKESKPIIDQIKKKMEKKL